MSDGARVTEGGAPSPELGQRASELVPSEAASDTSTTIGDAAATTQSSDVAATTGAVSGPTAPSDERVVLTIDDPGGDAGADAPPHGDLRRITVRDDGSRARITFELAGTVPGRLATGETAGIGFDMFHGPGLESDHQLFIDGGESGWTAYLQTPDGFVDFPGTFHIGGRVLELQVPWSSIGGRVPSRVSLFADTSQAATPLNRAWTDTAPSAGTADLRP